MADQGIEAFLDCMIMKSREDHAWKRFVLLSSAPAISPQASPSLAGLRVESEESWEFLDEQARR